MANLAESITLEKCDYHIAESPTTLFPTLHCHQNSSQNDSQQQETYGISPTVSCFVLGGGVFCLLLHFATIERDDARAVKGVVLQMPMFAQTLFHHLIPLPVNAVVEINTVVADAPLAQGVVVVEARRVVNRHLMANFSSGGATV